MIRVELPWLVFFWLSLFLAGILGVWLLIETARRRRARRALQFRVRCAVCRLDYEDRSPEILPVCPRCGSPNERVPIRIF